MNNTKEFTVADAIKIQKEQLLQWKSVLKKKKYILLLQHIAVVNSKPMKTGDEVLRGNSIDNYVHNNLMDKVHPKRSEFNVEPKSNF
jgi:hypothetical protein